MKYMCIPKGGALVYINDSVCGLKASSLGVVHEVILTMVMSHWQWGVWSHSVGARANCDSSIWGYKPLRVLMTQGLYRSLGVLHPQSTSFMFGLHRARPAPLSAQLSRDPGI